jgi:hypothetical protein
VQPKAKRASASIRVRDVMGCQNFTLSPMVGKTGNRLIFSS